MWLWTVGSCIHMHSTTTISRSTSSVSWNVQGGAEPTDTFQMVIDNIWKQGKISETVYKYVQVCYLLPTDYKLIFWTSGRWPSFTSMHCCKRVRKLPYTRLRRSSSIAATSSTMACLSSWIVMIRLRNTRSCRNPPQKKIWYSKVRWLSRPSDVAETTNTGNTLLHVPTLHCNWPYEMVSSPLPFPFPPTTTNYRASAIFKFEMCQSAPRHPVHWFSTWEVPVPQLWGDGNGWL